MFSELFWKGLIIDYIIILLSTIIILSIINLSNEYMISEIIKSGIYSIITLFILITIMEILFYYIESE